MAGIWTPLELIGWTQEHFAKRGIDAPRLTAELLLASALRCDRVRLYLDFDKPIGEEERSRYRELVRRRAEGEPTAYLVGRKEFYGRAFEVDRRALIPRPETELLVDAALEALPEGGRALDLCTGSGCIAVSLALGRKGSRVDATDLSEDAMALARSNAAAFGAEIRFSAGDLWAAVGAGEKFDVVAANPPYVPSRELAGLSPEVKREPRMALDGGEDGLDLIRRIVKGAPAHLSQCGTLVVEMHESHDTVLPGLCLAAGFDRAEVRRDLAGLPRLTIAAMAGRKAM